MTGGKVILNKMKAKVGLSSSTPDSGKGKSKDKRVTYGYHLVKGQTSHPREDYVVAEFKEVDGIELGLFAIFDGHLGHHVADYLASHLFENILKERNLWRDPVTAIKEAYKSTDKEILDKELELGRGGSTAVTAILKGNELVVANVGDSRAVLYENGEVTPLTVDHEPNADDERKLIEERGGFVSNIPGDVPRVDGQLAVARAFGDRSLKAHLSSDPDVKKLEVHQGVTFLILASDGLWKVMSNQEAVNLIKDKKDAHAAAKLLIEEAVTRKSKDDISCIVVRFDQLAM